MNISKYKRIMIVGNNGSGKSFLSKVLSDSTGLPVIHLDVEFWRPNWEMPLIEEWIEKQMQLMAKDKWIMDGNHTGTMELRFKAADLVIFLDINRLVCLASVIARNGKKRSDTSQYNEEKLDKRFLHFCKGVWNFSRKRKPVIMNLHKQYSDKPFFVIGSRREMNKLLKHWRRNANKLNIV